MTISPETIQEDIIEDYGRKDKRIKAFFHKKNMGIARPLMTYSRKHRVNMFAYIDSDDVWDPLKLEKQLSILEKNKSIVVWCEGEIIDKNSIPTGKKFSELNFAINKKKSGRIFEELLPSNFILDSSLIHRKDFVEGIQFDEKMKYLNGYKYVVDLANEHQFFFIEEPLARYRLHGNNSNMQSDKKGSNQDSPLLTNISYGNMGKKFPRE